MRHYLKHELPDLLRNGVRLNAIGRIDALPPQVRADLEAAESKLRERFNKREEQLKETFARKEEEAAAVLKKFGIPFEMTVASAHRSPERAMAFAAGARKRGGRSESVGFNANPLLSVVK